jgi:probable rRNA maturation factor
VIRVDVSSDGVRSPVGRERAAAIVEGVLRAEKVRRATISVTFLGESAIARLNREHLGHRGPTDVISFPLESPDGAAGGDIYIAPDVARESARQHGIGVREEVARLLVHGTLHVLGYDHPEGDADVREGSAMWRRQEQLLSRILREVRG